MRFLHVTCLRPSQGQRKQLSTICGFETFAVPPGGVIPAPVYRAHLDEVLNRLPGMTLHNSAFVSAVRGAILDLNLSPDLEAAVDDLVGRLAAEMRCPAGDVRFAVRSSGVLEDGAAASFAGQYDSVLNVSGGSRGVCNAVKQVWASQWSEHIVAYLRSVVERGTADPSAGSSSRSGGVTVPDMAVVVQAQVSPGPRLLRHRAAAQQPPRIGRSRPEQSGVLFTVCPDRRRARTVHGRGCVGPGQGPRLGRHYAETCVVEFEEECGVEGEASSGSGGGSSASYDPLLPCLRVIRRRAQPQLPAGATSCARGAAWACADTGAAERRNAWAGP